MRPQLQREQLVHQRLQVMLFLRSRHQIHKDFSGCVPSPQEKMAQIPRMLHLFIIADVPLAKIFQHTDKDLIHILMDQLTVRGCQDIISAPLFMEPERKGTVLIFIAEGELHLIPVSNSFGLALTPSKT